MSFEFRHTKGFTLIELLIVIGIVGLLATFAVVQLTGSRDKARIARGAAFASQMRRLYGGQPVGRWRMDEGAGTAIADSSGNAFHGTLPDDTMWSPGPSGDTSIHADGVRYATIPSLANRTDLVGGTNGKLLLMAWIRPTEYTENYHVFTLGLPGLYYCAVDPSRVLRCMGSIVGPANSYLTSVSTIPLNTWTHVAVILEAGIGYRIYIDGKLDRKVNNANLVIGTWALPSYIGRYSSTAYWFRGEIDDVEAYYASVE